MQTWRFLRQLFGSDTALSVPESEQEHGFDVSDVIPVVGQPQVGDSIAESVRRVVAECKGISINDVRDDMRVGREGRAITMNLVLGLGKSLLVDDRMTVGDLIRAATGD